MVDEKAQPGILLRQVVLRQAQFRHNEAFDPTKQRESGEMSIGVSFLGKPGGIEGVTLTIETVESDPRHPYFLSVEMAGMLAIDTDAPNMSLEEYVQSNGVALLFPFVRQVVADLSMRGHFGPIWLNPINIKALMSETPDAQNTNEQS